MTSHPTSHPRGRAAAPSSSGQLSSSYRYAVGHIQVTAILDSLLDFPPELMVGAQPEELRRHHHTHSPDPRSRVTINCYLVETGSATVLIDTGMGGAVEPARGRLATELSALGIAPTDITHVLFTHLHSDHAGGAVTGSGEPSYPNARYVAHPAEKSYWFDHPPADPEPALVDQFAFSRTLAPLVPHFGWTEPGLIVPGVELRHLPGHTPGHSGYIVSSGDQAVPVGNAGEPLLIWGDIVHQPHLQLANPAWGVAFDADPAQAATTRVDLLAEVTESRQLVSGLHLDFPGIGRIHDTGAGSYRFQPALWQPQVERVQVRQP